MSYFTIIGVLAASWALLSVLGNERQKELIAYKRKLDEENQPAAAPARPINLPGAAAPVPHPPHPPAANKAKG